MDASLGVTAEAQAGAVKLSRRWEAILAGEGGHGMVVAGVVLGEAAVRAGLWAVQSQWVLGSAARGSLARSEVVIAPEEIAFPRVRSADVLIAMTRNALERHLRLVSGEALIIVDETDADDVATLASGRRLSRYPILRLAAELGHTRSANMTALGVLIALSGILGPEPVEEAIAVRFGSRAGSNVEAFRAGADLARGRRP